MHFQNGPGNFSTSRQKAIETRHVSVVSLKGDPERPLCEHERVKLGFSGDSKML